MKRRILLVRSGAFYTARLTRTARALRESGAEVHVLGWNRGGGDQHGSFREEIKAEGYPIDEVWVGPAPPARGIYGIPKRLQYSWAVMRYIRRNGPFDVIHAIDLDSALPAALARRVSWHSGCIVYDIADYLELYYTIPEALEGVVSGLSRWVMREADALVIPDENRRSGIPNQLWKKTAVVTNAPDIDDAFVSELREDSMRFNEALSVFYYGSFSGDRGIELLLQAAPQMQDVHFWFAGWGKLTEEIKRVAQAHDHVHFLGRLSHEEVLHHAAEMDLISMVYDPNHGVNRMASPNKLFEAMAVGRPVIVAYGTSIDRLVDARELGWVVHYDAEAIVRLLRTVDQSDIQRRGKNAAASYEEFRWEASKKRLLALYESIMC